MNAKVLVVEDHPLMRQGLCQVIAGQPGLTVVGEASSGAAVLRMAAELAPDILVMDIHLPDTNGIELTRRVLEVLPTAKVVIFSGDATRALVDDALQAGAHGYIWKQSATDELVRGLAMVMEGRLYLSPELSASILEDYRKGLAREVKSSKPPLSERERELLRLVAEGRRNKEIADRLALSPKSVEAHRSRLMKRLGCSSSAELVRYAIREGIAEL